MTSCSRPSLYYVQRLSRVAALRDLKPHRWFHLDLTINAAALIKQRHLFHATHSQHKQTRRHIRTLLLTSFPTRPPLRD